ncbi:MAG: protoheme IX farnesyltransferase [Ignavibacteriales bacterium]|nr:protoheme IX farnesyltransferase [Ignavibacteriales bacterium]
MASSISLTEKFSSKSKSKSANLSEFINILSELTKFRITFFVSVTTFVGFILQSKEISFDFIYPALAVLVLASGASALNEYQERYSDSRMKRTSNRPIPSGRLSETNALYIALSLIFIGSLMMLAQTVEVFVLGVFTLFWYNLIYTPLKKITSFAIIPGSLVGAMPPIIGWAAAGGNIFDNQILSFASFMFIWQIPHFWLLVLLYDDQYKQAKFPTLSDKFNNKQIVWITFFWIVVLLFSSSLFIFSELSVSYLSNILLAIFGLATFVYSLKLLSIGKKDIFRKTFLAINAYVLFVLITVSVENLI